MATTTKGYPYPVAADLFNVPGDIQALATVIDANPGVAILTRAARVALAGAALWDGRVVFDTDWDQWLGYSAGRARWEFIADRITISTGVSTAIGATPTGLLNTTDIYVGLTVRNRNTADPSSMRDFQCVDTSPVTWLGGHTTFTPALTATTTNPTLGTGALVDGNYNVGPTGQVQGAANITFGTSGVAAGTGSYRVSLPVAALASSFDAPPLLAGSGFLYDSSTNTLMPCAVRLVSATTAELYGNGNGAFVAATVPWTWAAQDQIAYQFNYLAA